MLDSLTSSDECFWTRHSESGERYWSMLFCLVYVHVHGCGIDTHPFGHRWNCACVKLISDAGIPHSNPPSPWASWSRLPPLIIAVIAHAPPPTTPPPSPRVDQSNVLGFTSYLWSNYLIWGWRPSSSAFLTMRSIAHSKIPLLYRNDTMFSSPSNLLSGAKHLLIF